MPFTGLVIRPKIFNWICSKFFFLLMFFLYYFSWKNFFEYLKKTGQHRVEISAIIDSTVQIFHDIVPLKNLLWVKTKDVSFYLCTTTL